MKTKILLAAALAGAMFTSCNQSSEEKVKNANENVEEKKQETIIIKILCISGCVPTLFQPSTMYLF